MGWFLLQPVCDQPVSNEMDKFASNDRQTMFYFWLVNTSPHAQLFWLSYTFESGVFEMYQQC